METDEAACVLVSGHFIGMSPLNCLFLCQLIHFGIQHSSTNFITTVHSLLLLLLLLLHVLLVLLLPCSLYRVAPSRATEQATWPARSPDLTVPDFFLRGFLKDRVFWRRIMTIHELKQAIVDEVAAIDDLRRRVYGNFQTHLQQCIHVIFRK